MSASRVPEPSSVEPSPESAPGTAPQGADPSVAVATGQQVVDAEGLPLGTVKELREGDFLLARAMGRDVYVPFGSVAEVAGGQVTLTLRTNDISALNMETPSLL